MKEKDIDLLSSLVSFKIIVILNILCFENKLIDMIFKVNNRYNKNPKVDFQAEETLLHYLAQRSNNAFLFESIAEKVDNWFCSNRNGDTPIDIAASKVHF